MADPLILLKDFIVEQKPVYYDEDSQQVVFGETKLHRDTEVNVKSKDGKPLTLGSIWFFLKNSTAKLGDYISLCRRSGFPSVSFVDQPSVRSQLLPQGVELKPELFESVKSADVLGKREREEGEKQDSSKRPKLDQPSEITGFGNDIIFGAMHTMTDMNDIEESTYLGATPESIQKSKAEFQKYISQFTFHNLQANINKDSRKKSKPKNDTNVDKQPDENGEISNAEETNNQSENDKQDIDESNNNETESTKKENIFVEGPVVQDDFMPFLESDMPKCSKITRREKMLYSRPAITKPAYYADIMKTLQEIKQEERERRKIELSAQAQKSRAPPKVNPAVQSRRDKNFDPNLVWQVHLGGKEHEELNIDTSGSFFQVEKPQADVSDVSTQKTESNKPVRSSETDHKQRAPSANNDSLKDRHTSTSRNNPTTKESSSKRHPAPNTTRVSSNPNSTSAHVAKTPDKQTRKPVGIIIVPAAPTSNITLYNCRDFLENGFYKTPAEKKAEMGNKPKYESIKRTADARSQHPHLLEFQVIDNPSKLTPKDWERVVAVFTNGKVWELKGFFSENPTDVFTKIQGYHLCFDDDEPPENVKKWPVKLLQINKNSNKRHFDQKIRREFWFSLDEFIATKKPFLLR